MSMSQQIPLNPQMTPENGELQRQLSLLTRALGASSCGVTISDARLPDLPLIYINRAFEELTGYSSSEVIGRNCRFLQADERDQTSVRELQEAIRDARDCTVVLHNFRKDGQHFWNELVVSPVFDENDTLTHFIGVQTDITRRVHAEDALMRANEDLERKVRDRTQAVVEAYDRTLDGWVKALDIRDHETEGHTQRVTAMSVRLAEMLGMAGEDLEQIRRGSLLHDIGKIGVPDEVLLKPGALNAEERLIIENHPVFAFEWLSPISYLGASIDIPHLHHEKWDGTGYPRRLKGEEIPLAARLFAIVDVWDALSSKRPYRDAWPAAKVLETIGSLSGTHFDPRIVEAFFSLLRQDSTADSTQLAA